MTIKERIMEIVHNKWDMEMDNLEKIVVMAYCIGRESGVREVSDEYRVLITEQRERANKCRYVHMANKIIGSRDYIYHPDYAGEISAMFGDDETKL